MILFLLLLLSLTFFGILIFQPKCPKCGSKTVLLFKDNYKCVKCDYSGNGNE